MPALGHAERMPDYWELFSPTRGPAGAPNAFAGVKPEATTQLDAGLEYRHGNVEAWASAYAGRIDDYIVFDYMSGGMMGSSTRARNLDADIAGGEAGVDWKVADGLKLSGALAYAWGRTDDGALPQMPPLEARLSASGEHGAWSWGTLLRIAAAQNRVNTDQAMSSAATLARAPASRCSRSTAATASASTCSWPPASTTCSTAPTPSTSTSPATARSVIRPIRSGSTSRAAPPY